MVFFFERARTRTSERRKNSPSLSLFSLFLSFPSFLFPSLNFQQDKGYTFGNVVVTDSADEAAEVRKETWESKKDAEKAAAEKEAAEAREKAKKLAAEAEAKAKKDAAKAKKDADDEATTLAERIASLFDEGAPLEAFADAAEPLLDALDEREWLAWAIVAVPAAVLLAPLALLARRGAKAGEKKGAAKKGAAKTTVAAAKKKDVSTADDKVAAEADATAAAGNDSDEKAGATRRRARRD